MLRARVHLVRHGEVHNPSGVIYGHLPGFGLSEAGREQARSAARHLQAMLGGRATILASPLDRARETAMILREHLATLAHDPAFDERLIEVASAFDGLPRRFAPVKYLGRLLDPAARSRREPPLAVANRMLGVVRAAAEVAGGADTILVSHQFPIHMAKVAVEQRLGEPGASICGAQRALALHPRALLARVGDDVHVRRDGCARHLVLGTAMKRGLADRGRRLLL